MIEVGILCNINMCFTNNSTIILAELGCEIGMKCSNLVSLSTTTHNAFKFPDLGKPSTKSIIISAQGREVMGIGGRIPLGIVLSTLTT